MDSSSKQDGTSLSNLIHELSDFLQAQSEESATTTPHSGASAVGPRMRTVLLALLSECLEFRIGKERELATVLKLVTLAVQRYPSMVCGDSCSTALTMLQRIIPMFAQARFRNVHSALLGTVFSLVVLLPDGSVQVHAAVCRGVAQLVEDSYGALRVLEAPSLAAAQPSVTLLCLQGVEAAAKAEAESISNVLDLTSEPRSSQQAAAAASSQQALCTIELDSVQSSQLLCSMALELHAHCFRITPLAIHVWTTPGALTLILDLIAHAGFSLQASALNALAAILPELEFDLIPVHTVCTVLLSALDSRMSTADVPLDHPAFELWEMHMLTSLNLMAGMMDGSPRDAGAAESMLTILPRVAASLDKIDHANLQIQLCKLVLHMVKQYPGLSHYATELLMLLTRVGELGCTLTLIVELLFQHLGPDHLDEVFPMSQGAASQAATQGRDQLNSKRRRKTQFSQQLHSESRAPKHKSTSVQPLTEDWQAACTDLQDFINGYLAPHDGPTTAAEEEEVQHVKLQALLHVLVAAKNVPSAGLITVLGLLTGKWVRSIMQQQQLLDPSLVIKLIEVLTAFGGICMTHAQSTGTTDTSQTGSVAASMFLSSDVTSQQLEALLCMPWQKLPAASQDPVLQQRTAAVLTQGKINALLIQAASPLLGLSEMASTDFSSKQGSSALVNKALQDSDASVQAAAVVLLPVIVANTAEAAKGSARGQPTVGIRLLQKGLDCLLSLVPQTGSRPGIVNVALAHATDGFVNMQAVVEHKPLALCKAAAALMLFCQSDGRISKQSHDRDVKNVHSPSHRFSGNCHVVGLNCWSDHRQSLKELPVTSHGGASVPLKAIRSLADALLFSEEPDLQHNGHQSLQKDLMLQALLTWAEQASPEQAEAVQHLLQRCFALASSPYQETRHAFAREAPALVQPPMLKALYGCHNSPDRADTASLEAKLLQEVKQLLEQGQQQRLDIKETLLQTIAMIGQRTHSPSAQLLVLAVLVGRLDDQDPGIRSLAAQLLLGYAAARQCDLQDMILSLPRLKEFVGRNLLAKPNLLGELADLLDMAASDLALKIIPAAIPKLTEDKNQDGLEALAQSVGYGMQQMMSDYGHHVVAKYLYGDFLRFEAVMTFMESLIGMNFIRYVGSNMQRIIMETIFLAGSSADWQGCQLPESVFSSAHQMLLTLSNIHSLNNIQSFGNTQGDQVTGNVADFLAEGDHVTRILKAYGDALEGPDTQQGPALSKAGVSSQETYLRCVVLLVRLTGQYVARFLPQIMVLLSGALQNSPTGAKLQALEGWALLLRALAEHAPSHLAGMANQVVVTLLDPLQEGGAVAAAAVTVLEQLVVHARHLLGDKLKTLPPLPQVVEGLGSVNAVISEERGSLTTEESIKIPLKALADHSLSVRKTALQDIRNILHQHRSWLGGLLPANTHADGTSTPGQHAVLLSSLLGALLKCCDPEIHTPTSWKAQQLCAECLGLLGAVDPARVDVALDPPDSLCRSTQELLTTLIIKHLVRLLRVASHIFVLDAASFAIQELLRHYGMSEEPVTHRSRSSRESTPTETNTLFLHLPADIQNVVRPYLDSKFQLQSNTLRATGVIFNPEMSFRRWLASWMRQLTEHHASGELLAMFKACMPVIRCDIQSARFLMPYLLQCVISTGSPDSRKGVKEEIVVVLRGAGANKEGELCVQAIFLLLDVLKKWAEDAKGTAAFSSSAGLPSSSDAAKTAQAVHQLLGSIPQDLLAQAAAQCGAHARALLHYETHLRSKEGGGLNPVAHKNIYYSDDEVSFLQEVYGKLEEPDGLAGLLRLRQGPPRLQDQLLAAEKAGSWSEALALHEQALQHDSLQHSRQRGADAVAGVGEGSTGGLTSGQRGYLSCLLHMGHLQGMMTQVAGWACTSSDTAREQLAALRMAAAWRLGHWDVLEGLPGPAPDQLEVLDSDERWEVRLGKMLAAVHTRQADKVKLEIAEARSEIMAPLSAASMESYSRAYPYLVKLHMLQELSDAAAVLAEGSLAGPLDRQRRLRWAERLRVTQSSLPTREPILALRRQLAMVSGAEGEAGQCWLQHAKLCRVSGHFEAATTASLEALSRQVPGAGLEHAKLLWDMDKPHRAIISLQEMLQQAESAGSSAVASSGAGQQANRKRTEAKLVLQLATWMANTGQGAKTDITGLFERAVSLDKSWEKGYFSYAVYLDQLMRDARQRQTSSTASRSSAKPMDRLGGRSRIPLGEDQPHLEILPEVIRNYGLAVQYGHRHIFQSLPRLLTLWFDFGSHIKSITVTQKNRQISTAVANIMATMAKALPSYAWLTALPQLISRICHNNPEINTVTNHIITHVAEAYPQQALWALAAVQKSLVLGRKQAASAIMNTLKKHCTKPYNRKLYDQFPNLCDQLIRLCNHQPPAKTKSFSAKKDFAALVRSLPLDVMMPVNAGLTLTLPTSGCTERQHQPFAEVVTISDIKDEVELLPSLQKPKKVDLIGSDGRVYRFLAKPKDDLRKDNRMMEVASILNGLFAKDPASRRRNLLIRRFAVIPLTEETGIIEWVPQTHGLRHCCQDIYIADGTYDKRTVNMTVKKIYDGFQGKRKSELLDKLLALYPPVLHRWFLARFPEPATWHRARLAFTRTTAVWSMVGHIVGLGDRHGENILLDATTGDCVHVDFAFLFDRGLTLAIPEMVPFRLTQNLVDAFGVSGYEGAYRRACEVTLQVLRTHRDTLLSVLETLVHDPLVEWVPKNTKSGAEQQENAMARDAMATIEGRLTGTLLGVSSMPSLPLSTEGQAHRLIEEAVDKNNLGQMYIWWMPWL